MPDSIIKTAIYRVSGFYKCAVIDHNTKISAPHRAELEVG